MQRKLLVNALIWIAISIGGLRMVTAAGYFGSVTAEPTPLPAPENFQLLDSQQSASMAPAPSGAALVDQVAVPSNWQRYSASTNSTCAECTPIPQARFVESTWYTRIDYFHWNERIEGADFVNEDGPLFTLGYQRRVGQERFRGEFFGSSVHYMADIVNSSNELEPLSSRTNYIGVRGEYDYLFEPELTPSLSFFTGIGTRLWNRDLPDDFTASGTFVAGYDEVWWTVYPFVGLESRRDLQSGVQIYGMGRVGVTAITLERASVNDIALYPRPGVTAQLECGVRGKHLFVSAFSEVFSWQQSAVAGGWLQPRSTLVTVGVRAGVNF